MKKFISLFLSLTLLISLTAGLDFSAYAEGVDDFTYETFDEESVLITGYTGTEETVYVPDTIYGNKVYGIAGYAFYGCENLKSVTISSEIIVVGEYAFSQCTNLTDVNLGTGMIELGSYAFEGCYSLKRIAVSDVLAIVGDGAFNGCYAVTDIYFPGTEEMWNYVPIEDYYPYSLDNINVHFNSEEIHDYELFETVEPTCTVAGYEKYQCPCGYVRTVEIPETGHNYVNGECTKCEIVPYTLSVGETKNVSISQAGAYEYFSFVPESDGFYKFYSLGNFDTYAYLYDETWKQISYNDDGGLGNNFLISNSLEAGKAYYFGVRMYSSDVTGDFSVTLKSVTNVSSIEFIPVTNTEYIEYTNGNMYDDYYCYRVPSFTENDKLIVTDINSNQTEYFYTYSDVYQANMFISSDGDIIFKDEVTINQNQSSSNPWLVGIDNYYQVEYFGKTCNVPVTIVENPYSEIIYTPVNGSYSIVEGTNCSEEIDNNGESYKDYELKFELGDKITLVTKNGEILDYVYIDESWSGSNDYIRADFENENGETVEVTLRFDQYENHWLVGNEYEITVECNGLTTTTSVSIVENPVASIKFTPVNPIEYLEETNGYFEYDENGDEYYYYYNPSFETDDILEVTYKDGRVVEYTYIGWVDDSNDYFESSDGVRIDADDVSRYNDQYSNHWSLGSDNYITVEYLASTCNVPVTIAENPVSSIEFIPVNPAVYVENTNGYFQYDANGEEYFDYYTPWFEIGDILRINNKDGTIEEYSYIGWNEDLQNSYFESSDGVLISQDDVGCYSYQYNEHWTVGSDNYYEIEYLDYSCKVYVTITENPVSSIEFIPIKTIEYIENTNGYLEYDSNDEEYYCYYVPSFEIGDILKINYNNGSSVEYTYIGWQEGDTIACFKSPTAEKITAEEVQIYSNQYDKHWSLGSDNYYTVEYLGTAYNVSVTITESPVSSIDFIPVNPIEYIENSDGYYEYDGSGERYFYYNLPSYEIGDVLKVTENNGDVTEYTYIGWQDDGEEYFESPDAKRINADDLRIIDQQYEQHWTLGTNNYYSINYLGASCDVPIAVIENPINSIEFIPVNPVNYTENFDGYFEYDDYGQKYFYYYLPSFEIGDVLRINNKDGSVIDYTYMGWQESYREYVFLSSNGDYIFEYDIVTTSNQYEEHWILGNENYYHIKYLGIFCDVPVSITENNIKSIEYIRANSDIVEFTNGRHIVNYGEDGTLHDYYKYNVRPFEGDIFKVVYNDNTVEEYVCYKEIKEYEDGTKYDYYEFRNKDGNVINENYIDFSYSQSYDNCWTVGNSYPVQITYGGFDSTFYVNIVEHTHSYKNGFCSYCYVLEDEYELPVAKLGNNNVIIDEYEEMIMFSYTPKTNGTVNIFASGSYDTVGYLYDSNMKLVAYNDDYDSANFSFEYYMQANETYYIACRIYDDILIGDFTLNISQLDGVDFEVLEYVIEMINALSADDYSQESYDALIALLDTVPDDMSSLSQTEVDAYATQLLEGMHDLVAYLNLSLSAENGEYGEYTVTVNDSQSSYSSYSVMYGDSVTVNAQANEGYKFAGWYDTVSGIYKSNNAEYTFKMTANTSLKAVFVQEDSATLTFTTYSNWIEKEITNTVTRWNEITSIEDLLPDVPYRYGYSNGRWVYDNDEVLAKLCAGENVSIVAEYDADDSSLPTPPTPEGDTPVLDLYYKLDAGTNVGSFVMAAGLPENCQVESIGIAFYYDNANRFDPTRFELLINNKTLESSFSTAEIEDTYIVNVERFTSKDNWASRGYVTYYDNDGNLKTVYSNQINIVKREQV